MKEVITLSKEEEDKLLSMDFCKNEIVEFIFEKLGYDKKLRLSNDSLCKLLFNKIDITSDLDEYKTYKYRFNDIINKFFHFRVKNDTEAYNIRYLLCNIDYSNLSIENLELCGPFDTLFLSNRSIPINISSIYNKSLKDLDLKNCIIEGSFDDVEIVGVKIYNCCRKDGSIIKINPKKVRNKNFYDCFISGVEFVDDFDECNIENAALYNNKGVLINPLKVKNKSFKGTRINKAKFLDTFDSCRIKDTQIKNSDNLYMSLKYFNFNDRSSIFNGITIYVLDLEDFNKLRYNFELHYNTIYYNFKCIKCSSKYFKELENLEKSISPNNRIVELIDDNNANDNKFSIMNFFRRKNKEKVKKF